MATLDTTAQHTLLELSKRLNPDGTLADIAAILQRVNPVIQMMAYEEANGITYHKLTRQGALTAAGQWARLNEYISPRANQTSEATEVMGMLKEYNQVDVNLANMSGNVSKYRMDEAMMTLEGMSQTIATAFFYGDNSKDSDQFTGLAPRLASLQTGNYRYVIGGSGTGVDLTSVFVVMPDRRRCFMIFPRGSQAGLVHTDKGQVTDIDSNGKKLEVYRDYFEAHCGLAVKDTRSIARYANIEARTVGANGFDEDHLIELLNWMPEGEKIICVNREVATQMQIRAKDKNNVNYGENSSIKLSGEQQYTFGGQPVVKCEAIVSTETALT